MLRDRVIYVVSPDLPESERTQMVTRVKTGMLNRFMRSYPQFNTWTVTFDVGTLNDDELKREFKNIYREHGDYVYDGVYVTRERAEELVKKAHIVVSMIIKGETE